MGDPVKSLQAKPPPLCELFLLSCHFILAFKPVDKLVFYYYDEFVY